MDTSNTQATDYDVQLLIAALRENGIDDDFDRNDLNKFMCCCMGDVGKAAAFVSSHVAWKKEKLGMEATEKPDYDPTLASSGVLTVPGVRDRGGHLVVLVQPSRFDAGKHSVLDLMRFVWYTIDKAMDDPFTRQKGLVIVEDLGDVGMGFVASAFPSVPSCVPHELIRELMSAIPVRLRHIFAQFPPSHLDAGCRGERRHEQADISDQVVLRRLSKSAWPCIAA